jgi:HD-GYP domain-containing protein (c-di-GMP phosphodiesterase class II)
MPRMFDILRGKVPNGRTDAKGETAPKQEEVSSAEEKEEKKPVDLCINFPKSIVAREAAEEKIKAEDPALVSKKLIDAIRLHGVDNVKRAEQIYKNAVETVKILLQKIRLKEGLEPHMDRIYGIMDDVFNQLILGDNILENVYESRKGEYYLPYHIVNVLLLSSAVGMNMGFNKSRLSHLGLTSIFYDTGLDTLREVAGQPRKLNEEEHDLIKSHISKSMKVADGVGAINESVKETIQMHHERTNGKGYPGRLKRDNINPYAKIVGLMDTYESVTNDRPYRERINAHNAIRFILGSLKECFDPDVLKVFINKMSIYPIGSIVKLDTQELARVTSVQPGFPLRPVVIIIRDAFGKPVTERIAVDLSKQDFPAIQDSV